MKYASGQGWRSRVFKRVAGSRAYDLAKAARVAWPIRRDDYSQHGEEGALAALLPESVGTYLDIGSGNPVHLSNTYFLYRRSWSGVIVDPLWANATLSRLLRPKDRVYQALVSDVSEERDFYEMDPSFYSTTDKTVVERLATSGVVLQRTARIRAVPVRDLPFEATPEGPSLMSIDVEGHEWPVLQSVDWRRQSPRVIVIEIWSSAQRELPERPVLEFLATKGYEVVTSCGPDNFILRHQDSSG